MDTVTILGVLGTGIILISFVLNQFGQWSTKSRSYDAANAIGSLILVGYAIALGSVPFMVLNGVWFAVSFRDVIRSFGKKK
ncbi:MAG: hypothetical protein RLZZ480_129 [Candidatus Parcubacteria bacterium]|jgi:hypothetical protein